MNHILSLDELDIPFECQVQDMDDDVRRTLRLPP